MSLSSSKPIPWFKSEGVNDAARHAVVQQVRLARDTLGSTCAICGLKVLREDVHVDHRPPLTFQVILDMWLKGVGRAVPLKDAGAHSIFASEVDRGEWCAHHALFADLQVTHARCNLSQGGV